MALKRKWLFLLVLSVLSLGSFYAQAKPITIMLPLFTSEAPDPNGEMFKRLEVLTGEKVDINFVPFNNFNDKTNTAIASNQMPMVMTILDWKAPSYVNGARAGLFWDVTDMIKDYPNLSKHYSATLIKNAKTDGRLYGIPRARPNSRIALLVRKDWLAKLNLRKPTTIDELYSVFKAFAEKDPDGNGKNDTVGLLLGVDANSNGNIAGQAFEAITLLFGGGNFWEEKDGKLIPSFMTDANMKALAWMRKLYAEKLINQDFATVQSQQVEQLFNESKGGSRYTMFSDGIDRHDGLIKVLQSTNPDLSKLSMADAKYEIVDTVYKVKSASGTIRNSATPGFNGVHAFPKTSVRTEADLRRILAFFDKIDSPEGQTLFRFGIEGRHFSIVNGKAVITGDTVLYGKEVASLQQLNPTAQEVLRSSIPGSFSKMVDKLNDEQFENSNYAVPDLSVPLVSATYSERGPILDRVIYDARVKYVMGVIDDKGWQAAVDQWLKQGGDKVIAEYTEAY
ncbi:MAG: extracellular solute-binding protein, partial [Spirochaetota bacterium]